MEVHEYDGTFKGRHAHFKMTSVIGHVLSIDFPAKFQNWDTTDPASLFDAPTLKNESNPKVRIDEACAAHDHKPTDLTHIYVVPGTCMQASTIGSKGV